MFHQSQSISDKSFQIQWNLMGSMRYQLSNLIISKILWFGVRLFRGGIQERKYKVYTYLVRGGRLVNPTLTLMVTLIWQGVAPTPSHLENFLLHRRPSARFRVFKARQVVPNAPAPKGSSSWNPFNSSPIFTLSRDRQRRPVHCTGHWEAGRKWGYHVPQNAQLKLSSWTPKVERQMHRLPRRARTMGVFGRAQQRLVRAKISRGFLTLHLWKEHAKMSWCIKHPKIIYVPIKVSHLILSFLYWHLACLAIWLQLPPSTRLHTQDLTWAGSRSFAAANVHPCVKLPSTRRDDHLNWLTSSPSKNIGHWGQFHSCSLSLSHRLVGNESSAAVVIPAGGKAYCQASTLSCIASNVTSIAQRHLSGRLFFSCDARVSPVMEMMSMKWLKNREKMKHGMYCNWCILM